MHPSYYHRAHACIMVRERHIHATSLEDERYWLFFSVCSILWWSDFGLSGLTPLYSICCCAHSSCLPLLHTSRCSSPFFSVFTAVPYIAAPSHAYIVIHL